MTARPVPVHMHEQTRPADELRGFRFERLLAVGAGLSVVTVLYTAAGTSDEYREVRDLVAATGFTYPAVTTALRRAELAGYVEHARTPRSSAFGYRLTVAGVVYTGARLYRAGAGMRYGCTSGH